MNLNGCYFETGWNITVIVFPADLFCVCGTHNHLLLSQQIDIRCKDLFLCMHCFFVGIGSHF